MNVYVNHRQLTTNRKMNQGKRNLIYYWANLFVCILCNTIQKYYRVRKMFAFCVLLNNDEREGLSLYGNKMIFIENNEYEYNQISRFT